MTPERIRELAEEARRRWFKPSPKDSGFLDEFLSVLIFRVADEAEAPLREEITRLRGVIHELCETQYATGCGNYSNGCECSGCSFLRRCNAAWAAAMKVDEEGRTPA